METHRFPPLCPLCGEFPGHRWISLTKASDEELWCFLSSVPEKICWVNSREARALRRHRTHYDAIVIDTDIRPLQDIYAHQTTSSGNNIWWCILDKASNILSILGILNEHWAHLQNHDTIHPLPWLDTEQFCHIDMVKHNTRVHRDVSIRMITRKETTTK